MSNEFNKILVGGNDPLVHEVCTCGVADFVFKFGIENELLSRSLFPTCDVLNHKSVSVEPW